MERGNLIKWIKAVGDKVRPGDIIAEVETDKATMDVEAEVEGVLFGILIQEGAVDVPVNQVIGLIASEEEAAASERTRAAPAAVQNGAIHVAPVVAEAVLPVAPPLPDSHPPAFANGDAGHPGHRSQRPYH
jgi:pyruvate/2-oxoglutarate dehydrogenase complex dihydrolipoamide acyltransferase (E2) component